MDEQHMQGGRVCPNCGHARLTFIGRICRKCAGRNRPPCLHCKRGRFIAGRGLCTACYKQPTIRVQYVPAWVVITEPMMPKRHLRPPVPTTHPPGTVGKVLAMRERYANGESLWSPDDNRDWKPEHGEPLPVRERLDQLAAILGPADEDAKRGEECA